MREIKFRGKRVDNGEWVEGYLVVATNQINNGKCYILREISDISYGDNGNRCRIGCFIEVIPETVGQFTGLKDINGKKIYEGDILEAHPNGNKFSGTVYFDDAQWFGATDYLGYAVAYSGAEVVGNIHDKEV